jgi:organic radical activating enzyme
MQNSYKINEIYYSIQGEGFFFGSPVIFIRFSGCNLSCHFCDTQHDPYEEMSIKYIVRELRKYPSRHIVITGGEPYSQLDDDLIIELRNKLNYFISIETNGTIEKNFWVDWITCSPKRESGWKINVIPNEIKIIWDDKITFDELKRFHSLLGIRKYIQPQDNNPEYISKAIEFIKQYPQEWRLSLQCQKLINIK